jgi:hypothetical protein
MNTYFNEFTSKPEKLQGNGAYEKLPAGALCGNGDLGVVFSNDENDLIIHISNAISGSLLQVLTTMGA